MDFNDPIDRLPELLDRYNQEEYRSRGTWTVLAGMDDYFDLVRCHTAALPVLAVDPNPYWMGFYSSRPELKQRPTRIARSLLLAETLSAFHPPSPAIDAALRTGWEHLVLMNHHDAITGTSPDRVCHSEQRQWLDEAEAAAARAVRLAASSVPPASPHVAKEAAPVVRWRGRELHVRTAHHRLTLSKESGGCLTSLVIDGEERLQGLGLDLVAHADEGGLWRLGHEYRGGRFDVVDRASRRPARIEVAETDDALRIQIESTLGGKPFTRTLTCRRDDPLLEVRITGFAARRQTVTCRSELTHEPVAMEMDTLGGRIERPRERGHEPTFWPVPSLLSLRGEGGALHACFEAPTAVSYSPSHALEWIVARNPVKERAFGVVPVLAHPIGGTVDERQTHAAALFATHGSGLSPELREQVATAWLPHEERRLKLIADAFVLCDDPEVSLAAVKRADVGCGVIVRLVRESPEPRHVRIWVGRELGRIEAAHRCDAREEDSDALVVEDGTVRVELRSRLTTLRLLLA